MQVEFRSPRPTVLFPLWGREMKEESQLQVGKSLAHTLCWVEAIAQRKGELLTKTSSNLCIKNYSSA